MPVLLSIAIPLRNQGELTSLGGEVSNPASPLFRHFLSDQQVRADFLPTVAYDSMLQYVRDSGLNVVMTAMDSLIVVRATVGQINQYFRSEVSVYGNGTAGYYVNTGPSTFNGAYLYASNATAVFARPSVAEVAPVPGNVTFSIAAYRATELSAVYNATSLYKGGFRGSGSTIGILDFYGSPTISGDLSKFDSAYGLPDPPFSIKTVGPYNPNLGAYEGWSTEIALDVEVSHAMAPEAAVDLYVFNPALNLVDAISKIVQDNNVTTLSQSFTFPEWVFPTLPADIFVFNALLPDQYYLLGALKGISFMGATGDTGGMGDSNGPEGTLGYPSDSPYVTAAGGTSTYISTNKSGSESWVQTAWSNLAFVPNGVNYGGSSGGVSVLEPKPWYQSGVASPPGYPNGRLSPDLALQANVYPGTTIVDAGSFYITGGTSESSPLLAGLLSLVAQRVGGRLGLVNPFLYSIGKNPATYAKAFTPITFGYTIPWRAQQGYDLLTGWGSPNIGEISSLYISRAQSDSLLVNVSLSKGLDSTGLEFAPGSKISVAANVSAGGSPVNTGSFSASVSTLDGTSASVPLSFDSGSGKWLGAVTVPQTAGIAYVNVKGSSGSSSGEGFAEFFSGYWGFFYQPYPTNPWDFSFQMTAILFVTNLDGKPSGLSTVSMTDYSYNLLSNVYKKAATMAATSVNGTEFSSILSASIPSGPATLVLTDGVYGYLPYTSGIYLQNSFIYPELVVEPGSVAPGQSLYLIAKPIAPANVYATSSQETGSFIGADVMAGANVTAKLLDPLGSVVSTARLAYGKCGQPLSACTTGGPSITGYLGVPSNAASGLYTVLLTANYSSLTLGKTLNGSFIGQVWVAQKSVVPSIAVSPSTLFEGQKATIAANITYPDGSVVTHGMYTAVVYPAELQSSLSTITHAEYSHGGLVTLSYDASLRLWTATVTLPSPYDPGVLSPLINDSFSYAGPYKVAVSGISSDGFPTGTAGSGQAFEVQPYVYSTGQLTKTPTQGSGLGFDGATISFSGRLSNDLFTGTNTISGANLTIVASQIEGTLNIVNSHVNLIGVVGGNVSGSGSHLVLQDVSLGTLSLTGSTVAVNASTFAHASPPLPSIRVGSPAPGKEYNGTLAVEAAVDGSLLSDVSFYLDGAKISVVHTDGTSYSGSVSAASLPDGLHLLKVVASQSDGLSSTATVYFSSGARLSALQQNITTENRVFSGMVFGFLTLGTLAVAAFVFAFYTFRKKGEAVAPSLAK